MPTLFNFQSFLYPSPHKLFLSHQDQQHPQLSWHTHHHPSPKHLTICSCSIKKPRGNRKVKSNVELCNDIREFVYAVGLPKGHVPSMKELSEHGRNDLAYIVRRRGYKRIKELLANSTETDLKWSDTDKCLAEKHDVISDHEDNLTGQGEKEIDLVEDISLSCEVSIMGNHSSSLDIDLEVNSDDHSCVPTESSVNLSLEEKASYNLEGQHKEAKFMGEDTSSLNKVIIMDNHSSSSNADPDLTSDDDSSMLIESPANSSLEQKALCNLKGQDEKANDMAEDVPLSTEVPFVENTSSSSNIVQALNANDSNCMPISLSLEEKVAKFIQNGNLDTIEDNVYGTLNESGAEESKGSVESENAIESQSKTLGEENLEHVLCGGNTALTLNGSMLTSKQITPPVTVNHMLRDHNSSAEGNIGADFDKELDIETSKRENLFETNHLKFMLHQKELELSRLKEQIEKEKLALSILQAKAETEINKAQKLILEKDAELSAAEESFSGLEEVQIQYCGDGEIVEVTGSFNGWHHRIKMDPEPSASVVDPIGSRKSRLWSTVLWLYPGEYEIKFIVDGHWRIDPQRESITRGHICNNILRVYR